MNNKEKIESFFDNNAEQYSNDYISSTGYLGGDGLYFTRKYSGLFIFAAELNGVDYFEITGNNGADGGGNVNGSILELEIYGRTYLGFVKRVYNAGDPSINHLIIVESNDALSHEFSNNTNDDYHRVMGLSETTEIFYLLYAGSSGYYIDDNYTLAIMEAFLNVIDIEVQSPWISASEYEGTLPPGESEEIEVTFDATDLLGGDYLADIIVSSNDPDESEVVVAASLHVEGAPSLIVDKESIEYESIYVGASLDSMLVLSNTGTDDLEIYDIFSDAEDFSVSFTGEIDIPIYNKSYF